MVKGMTEASLSENKGSAYTSSFTDCLVFRQGKYSAKITRMKGPFTTPEFRKMFDINTYKHSIQYDYKILKPTDLPSDFTLNIELEMDTTILTEMESIRKWLTDVYQFHKK